MKIHRKEHNTIYVDMDGVVADFDQFVLENLGRTFDHKLGPGGDDEMWNFLKSVPHLYRILKPTPYAHEIMDAAKATGSNVEMLTAIPRRTALPGAEQDKYDWMDEHFPNVKVNIGPYSADKWKWAKPGHIIIDDRADNIKDWVEKGDGIGILHIYDNHQITLDNLKAITAQQYFI